MSAALLLALTVSGCARPATGVNAATPQTEDRIEAYRTALIQVLEGQLGLAIRG